MKKFILFAAILLASVSLVSAEGTGTTPGTVKEGDVKLTLNLNPFQSIEIGGTDGSSSGSTGGNVVLNYVTAEDYKTGVSTIMKDHISVVAAGKFAVYVKAVDANFTGHNGDVATSSITVTAKRGAGTESTVGTFNDVELTKTSKQLFASSTGTGTGNTFDVTYKGAGDNAYVDKLNGNEKTTYETTVTYTIAVN